MKYFKSKISIYYNVSAVPSSPVGPLEITSVQRTAISIKWKTPKDDGDSAILGYIVERKTPKSLLWTRVDKVDANTLELCCINLYEKTEYSFRVTAVNAIGHGPYLESDGVTLARSPFGKIYFVNFSKNNF